MCKTLPDTGKRSQATEMVKRPGTAFHETVNTVSASSKLPNSSMCNLGVGREAEVRHLTDSK